jgi:hypothetical protein
VWQGRRCTLGQSLLVRSDNRVELVQTPLLQYYILADDEAVGRHFLEFRHHAADVLVSIDEADHDRQFPSRFHEMRRVDRTTPEETSHRVEGDRAENALRAQIPQDFQVQRPVVPGIALGEIHGDLNGHGV